MTSNNVEIAVSNYTGHGKQVILNAAIDETSSDNAIPGSIFNQICGTLEVTPCDLDVTKTIAGSNGVAYTARRKVRLFARARDGRRSENLDFYIIEAQERYIVLAKASADKLFPNDTSRHVAPTCLDKGNDPKKFDKELEEKERAGREKALQAEAESERIKKEAMEKKGQSGSNNQPK